jgi:hypothetical protein
MHERRMWLLLAGVAALLAGWAPQARAQDFTQSSTVFAVVASNGALVRGNAATSSTRLGVGTYEVIFNRAVAGCEYNAGLSDIDFSGTIPPGEVSVAKRSGNRRGVFVKTRNSAGTDADSPFHLIVSCRT